MLGITVQISTGVLSMCNASCSSSFVNWFVNETLLSDISNRINYSRYSDRKSICPTTRDGSRKVEKNQYTEQLRLFGNTQSFALHLNVSCATHFICRRRDIIDGCTPKMCYSEEHLVQLNLAGN